ncbi:BACON domain-containing carbohydrate-binding protein [Pelagicoccus sp. SDUM812003]|uniref:BACON domain-containing protein n=1 Tax=Pelagicoccus sp. SDUM812003 TaxID=3041267 RepID=UPI00280F6013|nr:BACON domain-containing carbohydrate-binding protein [Pelagicoccus sp. SDUM812003]MDQ8203862.1 BACON domain-containing carbohydrate-binding protein [Pelagicoccus sp. SDUM812003]
MKRLLLAASLCLLLAAATQTLWRLSPSGSEVAPAEAPEPPSPSREPARYEAEETRGGHVASENEEAERQSLVSRYHRSAPPTVAEASQGLNARHVIRSRSLVVDLDAVDQMEPGDAFQLDLFEDARIDARLTRRFDRLGYEAFFAEGWADPAETIVMIRREGRLTAVVDRRDGQYRLYSDGEDRHRVDEIDRNALGECAEPLLAEAIDASADPASHHAEPPPYDAEIEFDQDDAAHQVRVLFLYTDEAEQEQSRLEDDAIVGIELANAAFMNSDIPGRLVFAGAVRTDYQATGDSSTDLFRLRFSGDEYMPEAHELRDLYAADLVCLVVDELKNNIAGSAYLMNSYDQRGRYGYSILRRWSVADLTLAHEIGHNLGATHDRLAACGTEDGSCEYTELFDYNFGYISYEGYYRTVMAYNPPDSGNYWRAPIFSNPDLVWEGYPAGVPINEPASADNRKVFEQTLPWVSAYRDSDDRYKILSVNADLVEGIEGFVEVCAHTPGEGSFYLEIEPRISGIDPEDRWVWRNEGPDYSVFSEADSDELCFSVPMLAKSENELLAFSLFRLSESGDFSFLHSLTVELETREVVISPSERTVSSDSQTYDIDVVTNGDWSLSSDSDWLTPALGSGTGSASITLQFEANPYAEARVALVRASSGADTFEHRARQEAAAAYLEIEPQEKSVGIEGGSYEIEVETNLKEWEVWIEEVRLRLPNGNVLSDSEASWIEIEKSDMGDAVTISLQANEGYLREATVGLGEPGGTEVWHRVTQATKPYGIFEYGALSLSHLSSINEADFYANTDWKLEVDYGEEYEGEDWISLSKAQGSGDATIFFEISENDSLYPRGAYVRSRYDTLFISQGGRPPEVEIDLSEKRIGANGGTYEISLQSNLPNLEAWVSGGMYWDEAGARIATDFLDWADFEVSYENGVGLVRVSVKPDDRGFLRSMSIAIGDRELGSVLHVLEQTPSQPYYLLDPQRRSFFLASEGGGGQFEIDSNSDWSIESRFVDPQPGGGQGWARVSPSEGEGAVTVELEVDPNPYPWTRSMTFHVFGQEVYVYQNENAAAVYTLVPENAIYMDASDGSEFIEVRSNELWQVQVIEYGKLNDEGTFVSGDDTGWLLFEKGSEGYPRNRIGINCEVALNESGTTRVARVKVSSPTVEDSFQVVQYSDQDYVRFDPATKSVSSDGETYQIAIESNTSWRIELLSFDIEETYISEPATWIQASPTSGHGNATISVRVDPNYTDYYHRLGALSAGVASHDIFQDSSGYMYLSESERVVPRSGEGFELTVRTNRGAWSMDGPDWVSIEPFYGAGEGRVWVEVSANITGQTREGSIWATDDLGFDYPFEAYLQLTQLAFDPAVAFASSSASLPSSGGSYELDLQAEGDWEIEIEYFDWMTGEATSGDWLQISELSGQGDATLVVEADENKQSLRPLLARVVARSVQTPEVMDLHEVFVSGIAYLEPERETYFAGPEAQTVEALVVSNDLWSAEITAYGKLDEEGSFVPVADANWATFESATETDGVGAIEFALTENESGALRIVRIALESLTESSVFEIWQYSENEYIRFNPLERSVGTSGDDYLLQLESNTRWRIEAIQLDSVDDDATPADWVKVEPNEGEGDASLSVAVAANSEALASRFGFLVTPLSEHQIYQSGVGYFEVSSDELQIGAEGGTLSIDVATNWDAWSSYLDYGDESNDGETNWISYGPGAGDGDARITFTVAKNLVESSRSVELVFSYGDELSIDRRCRIIQDAFVPVLSVTPPSRSLSSEASEYELEIRSNIPWEIDSTSPWVSVFPALGEGDALVRVSVLENPSLEPRQASVFVGDATHLIVQEGAEAFVSISPLQREFESEGGGFVVSILSNTNWELTGLPEWIDADKTSGLGDAQISLSVYENEYAVDREATLSIGEHALAIAQKGAEPWFDVSGFVGEAPSAGESFELTIDSNRTWAVTPRADWIRVDRQSGLGDGIATVTVDANTGLYQRTGELVVDGFAREIVQTGIGYFTLLESEQRFEGGEELSAIEVQTNYPQWRAESLADWITLNSETPTESSEISFSVSKNPDSASRQSGIRFYHMRGEQRMELGELMIFQAGFESRFAFGIPMTSFRSVGGAVDVAIESNVSWSLSASHPWLTVEPSSGVGDGTIRISVPETHWAEDRVAYLRFEEVELEVKQAGAEAFLDLNPAQTTFSSSGGLSSIRVDANTSWQVTTHPSWVQLESTNGTGDGVVVFEVFANESVDQRTGTLMLGDVPILLIQEGVAAFLDLDPLEKELGGEGGVYTVEIRSNSEWNVVFEEDWITVDASAGVGDGKVAVTVRENDSGVPRSAVLSISGVEHRILQQPLPYLIVTPDLVELDRFGGQFSLQIDAMSDWQLLSYPDWLTFVDSGEASKDSLTFRAAPNARAIVLQGAIRIQTGEGDGILLAEATVKQERSMPGVYRHEGPNVAAQALARSDHEIVPGSHAMLWFDEESEAGLLIAICDVDGVPSSLIYSVVEISETAIVLEDAGEETLILSMEETGTIAGEIECVGPVRFEKALEGPATAFQGLQEISLGDAGSLLVIVAPDGEAIVALMGEHDEAETLQGKGVVDETGRLYLSSASDEEDRSIQLIGTSSQGNEPPVSASELSQAALRVGPGEGGYALQIDSLLSWKVTGVPAWIQLDRASGIGRSSIGVTYQSNETTQMRETLLEIGGELHVLRQKGRLDSLEGVEFDQWIQVYYSESELLEMGEGMEALDRDLDNLTNEIEFALGLDPTVPFQIEIMGSGSVMELELKGYNVQPRIEYEFSHDFVNWQPLTQWMMEAEDGRKTMDIEQVGAPIYVRAKADEGE